MYTSYHFSSAQDVSIDLIQSIKAAYKNRAIIITVEENEPVPEGMTSQMVEKLDERLKDKDPVVIGEKELINQLKDTYGIPH